MRFVAFRGGYRVAASALLALLLFGFPSPLRAYSVLSHEALIDTLWDTSIKPFLLRKFPGVTAEQIKEAHAYCYGGSIIQDVGYYPFGSHFFSELTHYVRTGDFVVALLQQAQDLNEYAFAIGAMAHYEADDNGHPIAINRTVPEVYPELRKKYGDSITYGDNPTAHLRTEFAFDVVQVARGHYPSEAYHDFIGFQVSKPVLDRACKQTYGLKLKDIFGALDLSLGTYRWSVKSLIPTITKAAWADKQESIRKEDPRITLKKFRYNMSRSSFETEWGDEYQRPNFGARLLAFLLRLVPKVGPFKSLAFRTPPPDSELLFEKSFDVTVDRSKADLAAFEAGTLTLPNRDLDTGKPSLQGEYSLADQTYAELFQKLARDKKEVPTALQADYNRFQGAPGHQARADR